MIQLTETIQFDETLDIDQQVQETKDWFNENILSKIDFVDSCTLRDSYGRPSVWVIEGFTIEAIYFTENVNYNFNKFKVSYENI